jgi:peptidoglycan/xylan/chitin deacetylase (PgdA/CDA1 family)
MQSRLGKLTRTLSRLVPAAFARPFGRPTALFFHGVEPCTDDERVQTNHHEIDEFVQIVRIIKEQFQVLPLAALGDALSRPERHARTVFLMSDDGYANTLSFAADILDEVHLPWTLFVSTHHVDTQERNPIFLVRLFYYYAPPGRYEIPNFEPVVLGDIKQRGRQVGPAIDRLRLMEFAAATRAVSAMLEAFADDSLRRLLARFVSESFLSWPQIASLKKRGVEIGAHAHHHWAMHAGQPQAYFQDQARHSRARIIKEIGECHAFAYPFGNTADVSRSAWEAVRDAGYEYAFTTLSGTLDASLNRYLLPRFCLDRREPSLASLVPLLRGANPRLAGWQRKIAR